MTWHYLVSFTTSTNFGGKGKSNIFLPDTGLSSKIPHLELKVFVGDLLHIEAYGRNGSHNFPNLQHNDNLIQDYTPINMKMYDVQGAFYSVITSQ
jgi:hypothetical protein